MLNKILNSFSGENPSPKDELSKHLQEQIKTTPNATWYIFEDESQKNKALELVRDYRQIDDGFTFLKDYGKDDLNSCGIRMNFSKSLDNQNQKICDFFMNQDDIKVIEAHTIDADGRKSSFFFNTENKNSNILPFNSNKKPEDGVLPKAA